MNSSNTAASISFLRIRTCSRRSRWTRLRLISIRSCSQLRTSRSSMCMNSALMYWQYVSRIRSQHFAHGRGVGPGDAGGGHRAVEVALLDSQTLEFEFFRQHRRIAERVDVREQVAANPVVADHVVDAALEFDVRRQGRRSGPGASGCRFRRRWGRRRARRCGCRDGRRRRCRPVAAEQGRRLERRRQGAVAEFPGRGQGVEVPSPLLVE